jgi:hypothetical protein
MPVSMRDSEARKGENEAWFRELNERLEDRALERQSPDGADEFQIVCECAREECAVRITISVDEYERVRSNPTAFIVVTGHDEPDVERVVEAEPGHEIIEKFGGAGLVAQAEDPRPRR